MTIVDRVVLASFDKLNIVCGCCLLMRSIWVDIQNLDSLTCSLPGTLEVLGMLVECMMIGGPSSQ